MTFHPNVKLGRCPKRVDARTLRLASYLKPEALPVIPPMKNWGLPVSSWGMMRNDELGDCTCAAVGHVVLLDTANHGTPVVVSDDDIVAMYSKVSGYDPENPETTDNGAVELDVLNYWRKEGLAGHKILAYVAIDVHDLAHIREAMYLFGSVYTGVALPNTARNQGVWAVDPAGPRGEGAPGSWGGHAVPLVGYDTKSLACVTWGDVKWMTDDWWTVYGDEAYAVISEDWAPPSGAPNRFNLDQLKADLDQLKAASSEGK